MASKRALVRVGALALTLTTLTAGPPSDAVTKADVATTIALEPGGGHVVGRVKSARAGCKRFVAVGLFFKDFGASSFRFVAEDTSSGKGKYSISGPGGSDIPPGRYYVRTQTSKKCQASRSKTITVR